MILFLVLSASDGFFFLCVAAHKTAGVREGSWRRQAMVPAFLQHSRQGQAAGNIPEFQQNSHRKP